MKPPPLLGFALDVNFVEGDSGLRVLAGGGYGSGKGGRSKMVVRVKVIKLESLSKLVEPL